MKTDAKLFVKNKMTRPRYYKFIMSTQILKRDMQYSLGNLLQFALIIVLVSCGTENRNIGEPVSKKPNIVLIMADDQGWGDLGIHGNTNLQTPNIDALARNGVSFENFFVQPVCSPTRAELLTGRYAARLGVYDTSAGGERMNLNETTLAEVFRDAGYQTAAYGKWHNGSQPPYHPNARGFDDFYGFTSGHWGNYFNPVLEHNGAIVQGNGYLADDLTNHGLSFIETNKDGPFFLYLPLNTPHSPMQVPDEHWDIFKDRALEKLYQGEESEDILFTKAALAMVENIDKNVGRIMEKLNLLQIAENTIVIYLSDNGPNAYRWNGNMRGKKGSTDEGGVRSPFFLQWKDKVPKGKKIKEIAGAIDLLPTLASLAKVPLKTLRALDGKDLGDLILKERNEPQERLVFAHWDGRTSVRSQGYRLDHEGRLYDMQNDREQKNDISTAFPTIKEKLVSERSKWLSGRHTLPDQGNARPFTIGAPGFEYTHLPARDGIGQGSIQRSNKYPNDAFFTQWKSTNDAILWPVEILGEGIFEVTIFYTCAPENIGCTIELGIGKTKILKKIEQPHDPPLKGMESDRVPRMESYVKEFKPLVMGNLSLAKGTGNLILKATEIPGKEAIDFRLLVFRKLD